MPSGLRGVATTPDARGCRLVGGVGSGSNEGMATVRMLARLEIAAPLARRRRARAPGRCGRSHRSGDRRGRSTERLCARAFQHVQPIVRCRDLDRHAHGKPAAQLPPGAGSRSGCRGARLFACRRQRRGHGGCGAGRLGARATWWTRPDSSRAAGRTRLRPTRRRSARGWPPSSTCGSAVISRRGPIPRADHRRLLRW